MIENRLKNVVNQALKTLDVDFSVDDILIEVPRNEEHGDYATNVAFSLARVLRKAPKLIAEDIAGIINENSGNEEISAEPINGFINLNLSDEFAAA